MSRVLILSKTRMQENRVCVGGVDLDNRRSIRLLDNSGHHETLLQCPYQLLSVWDIDYIRTNRRPAPHLEDVNVTRRVLTSEVFNSSELLRLSEYNLKFYNRTPLLDVFDGKLSSTESGSLYISNAKGVPDYSTCLWICDRLITKNRFSNEQKTKYDYRDSTGKWYHITYVGIDKLPDTIPAGSLIRLSLAHWWHPENTDTEDRCFLQLSGVYNL